MILSLMLLIYSTQAFEVSTELVLALFLLIPWLALVSFLLTPWLATVPMLVFQIYSLP
jgi:hypothetical protein